jgi:hypothetical protein
MDENSAEELAEGERGQEGACIYMLLVPITMTNK